MAKFNNLQLVEWCKALLQINTPYWYGSVVYPCSEELLSAKTKQYPGHYTLSRMPRYKKDIANHKICCDCVGMIKGFFWTNNDIEGIQKYVAGTGTFANKYASNGMIDCSAEGCFDFCRSNAPRKYSNDINSLPEVPGVLVFAKGHVGVYIGEGYAIEARGFAYGVVKTRVAARNWNRWAYLPASIMDYVTDPSEHKRETEKYALGSRELRKGMEGTDVEELQTKLLKLGYDLGNFGADGEFGSRTQTAVKGLQSRYSLACDGVVDEKTLDALNKALEKLNKIEEEPKVTHPLGSRSIRRGMTGNDVRAMQEGLLKLGYQLPKYGADGDYGSESVAAVKAFQADKGLVVDGIFGAKSLAAFNEALAALG